MANVVRFLHICKKVPIECLYRMIGFVYQHLFTSSSSIKSSQSSITSLVMQPITQTTAKIMAILMLKLT